MAFTRYVLIVFMDMIASFFEEDKSILVEEDSYLLELARYIHRNPLRAEKFLLLQ